ncbi:efflux RND transporter periplasmic adaptor subunit [Pseudoduganella sp. OTU4001]|uniref:efflux RND transporter periplasmic adaptor subunit n=1 Tax=Pseudoduganella sp. OTU4001 TaxID=3043854 RepID=UPI00313C596C
MNAKLKLFAAFVGGLVFALVLARWWPETRHATSAPAPQPAHGTAANNGRAEVTLPQGQERSIGLRAAPATLEESVEDQRAAATIVPDESRIFHIHTRVSGWVEKLHVPNTGERVKAGQPIIDIFSQELYASQLDHLAARAFVGPPSAVVESGRTRLKFFGMSEREIEGIEATGKARKVVTLYATGSGILAHRGVAAGTAVDPSTEIAVILDLSRVWAIADVPVAATDWVRIGQVAQLQFGQLSRTAKIEFIEPMVSESRTLKVRFALENTDGLLRPGMYGTAAIKAPARKALTVPREAVVDTGEAQYVYQRALDGKYVPRRVRVGRRSGEKIEILDGIEPGAMVVVSGVFLLDSESRLRGSGGQATHGGHGSSTNRPAPEKTVKTESEHQHD